MRLLLERRQVAVWIGLVGATLLALLIGESSGGKLAAVAVLVVAFGKIALVGNDFMELRRAPAILRIVFGGWVVVVFGVLAGFYIFAT